METSKETETPVQGALCERSFQKDVRRKVEGRCKRKDDFEKHR